MSTRGAIAVGTLDSWRGIYNHYDSYPTGLGAELWEHLLRQMTVGQKTLKEIGESILMFDDWRNYLKGGICEYCGKMTGQPHSISGDVVVALHDGKKYPDPEAKRHSHNSLTNVRDEQLTKETGTADDSWLEWIYVIDPQAEVVHVLCSRKKWRCVASIPIRDTPNWPVVECGAEFERCSHYAWAHFPELSQDCRLGTREYIGAKSIHGYEHACAYLVRGVRYRRGGAGMCGTFARRYGHVENARDNHWVEELIAPDGARVWIPVAVQLKKGAKPAAGVQWVFPPTLKNPQETVR